MIHFNCENCHNTLFFENYTCLNCDSEIGFDTESRHMVVLDGESKFKRCKNGIDHQICNWVVPKTGREEFCESCQLNRTIPDLSDPMNLMNWGKMEVAKRRTLYTLAGLGLRPHSALKGDDGLTFEFMKSTPEKQVLTGHENGVIVINLDEADDAHREKMRTGLGEPYRTLVGHFRHEIGHYYWDQLLLARDESDSLFQEWRTLFGDENLSYADAMQKHYKEGPPPNWANTFISSYATMHPWEDWAETWANYLHIVDGMETVKDFGWDSKTVPIPFTPFKAEQIGISKDDDGSQFLSLVNSWARLAPALNEIALSLGQGNLFPFVFTATAVRKMHFVHMVVKEGLPPRQKAKPAELPDMAEA